VVSGQWSVVGISRVSKPAVVFIFLVFAVVACAKTESRRSEYVIAESKSYEASLYRQNCAICHGAEAHGKQIGAQFVPGLRYGDAAKRTDEEIYQQLVNGKMPMPSFKNQLTEEELWKMVRFIRKDLQGRE
jgi:cytochrome c